MTSSAITSAIDVQPGALFVTAPADTTVEQLNGALAPYGLCLPIIPLVEGLALAELVARNAGGRRMLRYGPIGRYLRAGVIEPAAAYGLPPATRLVIGGPTIKRATGYGLNRAIAGGAIDLGAPLEFTFSLRPLPGAQSATLLRVSSLGAGCELAASLLASGLALSALAVAEDADGGLLLAELEGSEAVVARQRAALRRAAELAGARAVMGAADPWALWEDLAAGHVAAGALALSLTLPRRALPAFAERASAAARRYGLPLRLWGDGGVGVLHVSVAAATPGQRAAAEQLLMVLKTLAVVEGGAVATEFAGSDDRQPTTDNRQPATDGQDAKAGRWSVVGRQSSSEELIGALRAVVGEGYLLVRGEDLATYETDASIARPDGAALAVALPANTAEVAELVRLAAANSVPVVTRGAGSGLAGGATPTRGALVISLNRLEAIQIDREQMVAHVGGGAITAEVQKAAEGAGLFYPPDPSSQTASTIGGNIACNAGGPRCVKYGVTADYVLAVTVVLADGSVARWGDRLSGQDPRSGLVQLLVGSEGTLGIITEATLRLIPLPAARRTTMALFASLEAACSTVEQIMAAGIVPAGLELMDDSCLVAVEGYLKLGLPQDAGAMLLMLADGEPEEVDADTERLAELARAGGASSVQVARSAADEANLWKARRGVSIALARVRPNRLGEDISVPLPQIAACVRQIKAASVKHGLPIVVFGHAGDGNLHPNILFDAKDPAETARIWPAAEDVFGAALAVGGTLSGEHGIGTLKKPFMRQALGEAAIAVQRRIKQQFDPAGLLNPGKVLPE
jgi:glycolate oxidase subunit GlcD